jgi:hypothetical protein
MIPQGRAALAAAAISSTEMTLRPGFSLRTLFVLVTIIELTPTRRMGSRKMTTRNKKCLDFFLIVVIAAVCGGEVVSDFRGPWLLGCIAGAVFGIVCAISYCNAVTY